MALQRGFRFSLLQARFTGVKSRPTLGGRSVLTPERILDKVIDHRVTAVKNERTGKFAKRKEVLVTDEAPGGYMVLNRGLVRNLLNENLLRVFDKNLRLFDHAQNIRFMMVRGGSKDFSVGTDLNMIYNWLKEGDLEKIKFFLRGQYTLARVVYGLKTPLMSFWHGTVQGGGANGISLYGKYRFASGNVQWRLPECQYGYFPDCGTSFMLSRLPASFGQYIALTGHTLGMSDLLYLGIATHAIALEDFTTLVQVLTMCEFDDYMEMNIKLHFPQPRVESDLFYERHMIHRCFSADSVEEIMSRLEKEDSDKARECLKSMSNASPLSLCVTHKLLKTVENLPLHECLMYDYRLATNFLKNSGESKSEFYKSLEATAKKEKVQWRHSHPREVETALVDSFFEPLSKDFHASVDKHCNIFHEFYDKTESLEKDTNVFIGGFVTVGRDWDRTLASQSRGLPPVRQIPKTTGSLGW